MSNTVSIVLPTYNRGYILDKSINSVLNQTYKDFELIVVDDGSTDNTKQIVESFKDDRIKYYYTKINQGASAARNYGIRQATGEYVAFQDSDDFYRADKLKKQIELIQSNSEYGFVYHKIRYDMGNDSFAILPDEKVELSKKSGDIYAQLLVDNLVDCPSLMVKRTCFDEIGLFNTDLKALEDYDLALRLAAKYKAGFVNEILLDSTYSTTGVSGSAINYLNASCMLVMYYKKDYLRTNTLNHRLEIILRDAQAIGMKEKYIELLEKIMVS